MSATRSTVAARAGGRPGQPTWRASTSPGDRRPWLRGSPRWNRDLHDGGAHRGHPRQGKISATRRKAEHNRGFRRLVKWRTGSEGRISYLKRGYGWDRSRLDGTHGAAIWCGYRVFAHNLVKISGLTR